MIGRARRALAGQAAAHRSAIITLAAVLVLGGVFGQRSADPFVADPALRASTRAALAAAMSDAGEALRALRDAAQRALTDGRTGAALTVAGDGEPGPQFRAAAAALGGGDALAAAARAALARVDAALATLDPEATAPRLELVPGSAASAAAQLADAADPADAFRAMRRASQATLTDLGTALAALDRDDPVAALAALDRADADLAVVRAWPGELATLPIWVDTTGRLLSAARRIAVAARDGDAAAAEAAGRDYQAAAADAHHADLALDIAVSEGGAAVSGPALSAVVDLFAAANNALDELGQLETATG